MSPETRSGATVILVLYIWLLIIPNGRGFGNNGTRDKPSPTNLISEDGNVILCPKLRELVTRDIWGAMDPVSSTPLEIPVKDIFIDQTYGGTCKYRDDCMREVRNLQYYHMTDYKLWDIGYNFLVGNDARTYEGRGFNLSRSFDPDYNSNSLSFAIIGDFKKGWHSPKLFHEIHKAIKCGQDLGYIAGNYTIHESDKSQCQTGPGKRVHDFVVKYEGDNPPFLC